MLPIHFVELIKLSRQVVSATLAKLSPVLMSKDFTVSKMNALSSRCSNLMVHVWNVLRVLSQIQHNTDVSIKELDQKALLILIKDSAWRLMHRSLCALIPV